jgi:hypothetical protein
MKKFIFLCFTFTGLGLITSTVLLMEEHQMLGFLTLVSAIVGGIIAVRDITEKVQ